MLSAQRCGPSLPAAQGCLLVHEKSQPSPASAAGTTASARDGVENTESRSISLSPARQRKAAVDFKQGARAEEFVTGVRQS